MSALQAVMNEILVEGEDLFIDDDDLRRIRRCLPADGSISLSDLKVLTEMRTAARATCEGFDALFFPALKRFLLADGQISQAEQFLLLRMLYGGGGIDENERRFLIDLRNSLSSVSPEFEALYRDAMSEK